MLRYKAQATLASKSSSSTTMLLARAEVDASLAIPEGQLQMVQRTHTACRDRDDVLGCYLGTGVRDSRNISVTPKDDIKFIGP